MKTRYLVIGLVLVLAVVTGVLIYQGRGVQSAGQESVVVVTETETVAGSATPATAEGSTTAPPSSAAPPTSQSSAAPTTTSSSAAAGAKSNVPMRKLKAGEKAPQFIIFSFDGVGSHEKWQEFMAAAEKHDARINGFLTGLYLLTDDNADKYTGPRHKAGASEVGFGGDAAEVATRINDLNEALDRGHEIGTHYNGHFCGVPKGGAAWSSEEWSDDLGQFMGFVTDYRKNNPGAQLPELKLKPSDIKGGRTQCLDGTLETLIPVWKKFDFTYDSSINSPTSGVSWPSKRDGIWEFYMPYVFTSAFPKGVINMDYNLWVRYNGGENQPETAPELRQKVYENYTYLYDKTFNGNRAPLLIANHFNNWNGNSFNPATLKFMEDYCGKPDTICATYSDVVAWLELQDPAVREKLLDQAAVAATKLS